MLGSASESLSRAVAVQSHFASYIRVRALLEARWYPVTENNNLGFLVSYTLDHARQGGGSLGREVDTY